MDSGAQNQFRDEYLRRGFSNTLTLNTILDLLLVHKKSIFAGAAKHKR